MEDTISSPPAGSTASRTIIRPSDVAPLALVLSRVLLGTAVISQIVCWWHFRFLTWDDSAITLGFARTFALTGRIEPTPGSGIVEGYSSTLWMLLMAAMAELVRGPHALLIAAKTSSLVLNLVNLALIRRWFMQGHSEWLGNLIAGFFGCTVVFFYESINGMETPLLLTLVLIMLLLVERETRAARISYLVVGCAFVLLRFEAAWLLVPFLLLERSVRTALSSAGVWLCALVASNAVRWYYFRSMLPNTVIAKSGLPYSHASTGFEFRRHFSQPKNVLVFILPLLILAIVIAVYRKGRGEKLLHPSLHQRRFDASERPFYFCLAFTLFTFILLTAIGWNWGPPLRSFYPGWPFLLGVVFLSVLPKEVGAPSNSRLVSWATVAICAVGIVRLGMSVHDLAAARAPLYMPFATVDRMNAMNSALHHIQNAAHQENIVYAGPDIGAIMLYSNDLRIVDLGLLCDPVLARKRYSAVKTYVLDERHPDVIEVHEKWTSLSRLGDYPTFMTNYEPVYVEGVRVFLTRRLIGKIEPARLHEYAFGPKGDAKYTNLTRVPYINYQDADMTLNREFGHYLVLD